MDVQFADNDLERLEVDVGYTGGFPPALVKVLRRRMQFIRDAHDERDFYAMKSLHFERLKGRRRGEYSMRLNDQMRLIVRLDARSESKTVVIVGVEDYH